MVQNFSTFLSDGRGLNPYLYTIGLKSQVALVAKPMTYLPAKTHGVIFEHGNIWGHCVSLRFCGNSSKETEMNSVGQYILGHA